MEIRYWKTLNERLYIKQLSRNEAEYISWNTPEMGISYRKGKVKTDNPWNMEMWFLIIKAEPIEEQEYQSAYRRYLEKTA